MRTILINLKNKKGKKISLFLNIKIINNFIIQNYKFFYLKLIVIYKYIIVKIVKNDQN